MSFVFAENETDTWLPDITKTCYPALTFKDITDLSREAEETSRRSAADHAISFTSCRVIQGEHTQLRRNRMIHGHDVVVRRVLWDAAHVRPAVDVLGYRRLEKKTKDWYGHSKIPWVKEVAENVKLLREGSSQTLWS